MRLWLIFIFPTVNFTSKGKIKYQRRVLHRISATILRAKLAMDRPPRNLMLVFRVANLWAIMKPPNMQQVSMLRILAMSSPRDPWRRAEGLAMDKMMMSRENREDFRIELCRKMLMKSKSLISDIRRQYLFVGRVSHAVTNSDNIPQLRCSVTLVKQEQEQESSQRSPHSKKTHKQSRKYRGRPYTVEMKYRGQNKYLRALSQGDSTTACYQPYSTQSQVMVRLYIRQVADQFPLPSPSSPSSSPSCSSSPCSWPSTHWSAISARSAWMSCASCISMAHLQGRKILAKFSRICFSSSELYSFYSMSRCSDISWVICSLCYSIVFFSCRQLAYLWGWVSRNCELYVFAYFMPSTRSTPSSSPSSTCSDPQQNTNSSNPTTPYSTLSRPSSPSPRSAPSSPMATPRSLTKRKPRMGVWRDSSRQQTQALRSTIWMWSMSQLTWNPSRLLCRTRLSPASSSDGVLISSRQTRVEWGGCRLHSPNRDWVSGCRVYSESPVYRVRVSSRAELGP